jgi:hypothetical protein
VCFSLSLYIHWEGRFSTRSDCSPPPTAALGIITIIIKQGEKKESCTAGKERASEGEKHNIENKRK